MTPREFSNAVRGYSEEMEQQGRESWEQARMIAYYAIAPHVKKGRSMGSLIPLPWDSPAKKTELDREAVAKFMHRLNKTAPGWQDRPLVLS